MGTSSKETFHRGGSAAAVSPASNGESLEQDRNEPSVMTVCGVDLEVPGPDDSEAEFRLKRDRILSGLVPLSLVPSSTSILLLMLGSRPTSSCYNAALPTYLMAVGCCSITMGVLTLLMKGLVSWILEDRAISRQAARVVAILYAVSRLLMGLEVAFLWAGAVVLYPFYKDGWQHSNPEAPFYCDFAMVTFPLIFFSSCWVLLLAAAVIYWIIWWHQVPTRRGVSSPK